MRQRDGRRLPIMPLYSEAICFAEAFAEYIGLERSATFVQIAEQVLAEATAFLTAVRAQAIFAAFQRERAHLGRFVG
jgi:hypothetical protein